MQKLKSHKYEGKNQEEVINSALKDLNASTNEVYTNVKEEITGSIFKSKKYKVEVIVCWNILLCRRNECKVIVTYRLFWAVKCQNTLKNTFD